MTNDSGEGTEKEQLNFLATRLGELNNTASQVLIFLSFAIVAGVTFLTLNPAPGHERCDSWGIAMVDRSDIPHRGWNSSFERDSGSRRSLVSRAAVGPIRADVVGHRLHFCWRDLVLQNDLAERIRLAACRSTFQSSYSFLHALSLRLYSACPIHAPPKIDNAGARGYRNDFNTNCIAGDRRDGCSRSGCSTHLAESHQEAPRAIWAGI